MVTRRGPGWSGKQIGLGLATAVLVLAALELLLRVVAGMSPRVALLLSPGLPLTVPDPLFGERPNPLVPDHDPAGWRNAQRLERAPVVAIGDSQTYGQGVAREEAWPLRLEARSGVPVYALALGGYGPVEYFLLMAEALRLRPQLVLVGLYAGNDLEGAFSAVYREARYPSLRSDAPEVLAAVARAEASRASPIAVWQRTRAKHAGRWTAAARVLGPLRDGSRLWGLARASRRALASWRAADAADGGVAPEREGAGAGSADPALLFPIGDASLGTVLTPLQRLAVLDTDDPRIAEGLRISLVALHRMREACAERCELVVVFLPTKELAFAELVASGGASPPRELLDLRRREERMWEQVRHHLAEQGIRWVDTLPSLRAAIARGENPYPADWDGHLNALGNDLVASAVAGSAALRELGATAPAPSGARSGGE